MDELRDLFDKFRRAGRRGSTSISLVGMNNEQIEVALQILGAGVKLGYRLVKAGVRKFSEWSGNVRGKLGGFLKTDMGCTDLEVEEWIREIWNSDFEIDGQTHTVAEWASILGQEEVKKKLTLSFEEKRKLQKEAEGIAVKTGDIENIRETLPFLLPAQHEDVLRAETQFFDPSHNDYEHAFGKGYMFTNGTGTGKTYTGLGIVKRFIKEGKGRILILTPSQTKVSDWIKDASNLGIDLRSLDEFAKESGKPATTVKGEGAVITTFANFRVNQSLMEDAFDLVVYDESHRICENKKGESSSGTTNHFKLTNRNESWAFSRLQSINPVYREMQEKVEEYASWVRKNDIPSSVELHGEWGSEVKAGYPDGYRIKQEFERLWKEYEERVKPQLHEEAKEAVARTKVVFLSATPFNTVENLHYAEGYTYTYPKDENGYPSHKNFILERFGSAYRWRYGRMEKRADNPQAIEQQEIAFSEYLQHELGTMSGRIIDSEFDYSRDFPTVTGEYAERFNEVTQKLMRDYGVISSGYWKVMGDYVYSSALFESLKTAQIIPRLRQQIAAGRKVVVFHRRVAAKNGIPRPFESILQAAVAEAQGIKDKSEKMIALGHIADVRKEISDMLEWEKGIDLRMPREQLADAFGSKNVLFFSGQENSKSKQKAVEEFNDDESGKNIIVIQEASGKEGISLHDTTGKHQRVLVTLALPQSPITALQIEGRIYRIGNRSNAIFEYPLLGLNMEMILFGQKFNSAVGTTENLALGGQARGLTDSFRRGVEEHSGEVPLERQGIGGKEYDSADRGEIDGFDRAVNDYYSNQNLSGRRDSREGVDYYPTPEPLGYMMAQWGMAAEGESVLEPSAGHGAIARYAGNNVLLTAIEPSTSLFGKLQMRAGGTGRTFRNEIFENYNVVNKHDVVLMNPPFGSAGRMAVDHVAKAFRHLEEGGRIVALIPTGSTTQKFDKWYMETESAVITGEVQLPSITFQQAGTSVNCRVVIIDKVSNKDLRGQAASRRVNVDLRGDYVKIEEFFEELRGIEMPGRTIDSNARLRKKALPGVRELRRNKKLTVELTEGGIEVRGGGVWFNFQWADPWKEGESLSKEALHNRIVRDYGRLRDKEKYSGTESRKAAYYELQGILARLVDKSVEEMDRELGIHRDEEQAPDSVSEDPLRYRKRRPSVNSASLFDESEPGRSLFDDSDFEDTERTELQSGRTLTENEADDLISRMEELAEEAPSVELTMDNWIKNFGNKGVVSTPIGEVKLGNGQYAKLKDKGRTAYFGMILPTLSNPDVIIEKNAPAEDAERNSKYLFIKTFVKSDGSRVVHFESVTVRRDGLEISISSHEVNSKDIKKDMQKERLLHISEKLSSGSEWSLTETPEKEGPDLVPTSDFVSQQDKVNKTSSEKQIDADEADTEANRLNGLLDEYSELMWDYLDQEELVSKMESSEETPESLAEEQMRLQDIVREVDSKEEEIFEGLKSYYQAEGMSESEAEQMSRVLLHQTRSDVTLRRSRHSRFMGLTEKGVPRTESQQSETRQESDQKDVEQTYVDKDGVETTYSHYGALPELGEGSFAYVERQFSKSGEFQFSGGRIETSDDVAYIFRCLEDKAIENVFAVLVKDGKGTVIHVGMGSVNGSMADLGAVVSAYNALGADQVYLVHNHPSGNLQESAQDRKLLETLMKAIPDEGVVQPGIIIDQKSGKYSVFHRDGITTEETRPTSAEDERELPVLRFDKAVFSEDYDITQLKQMNAPDKIAAFLSSQRLGERGKMGVLIMNQRLSLVANIPLAYDGVTAENASELGREIAGLALRLGGNRVVPFGNFDLMESQKGIRILQQYVKDYSAGHVGIMDVVGNLGETPLRSGFDTAMELYRG